MTAAFSISGLCFTYPDALQPAIHQVDLDIPEGAAMALLGPNGAGKSTLMDLILRWKKPDAGTIRLMDRPLADHSAAELGRLMALVPQEEQSQFAFSVVDYVLFGRAPRLGALGLPSRGDVAVSYQALEEVGLSPLAERSVMSLSGGEHQLLLLARAIAQQTPILLLDEPTSALDPANTANVVAILKRLHRRGATLLFTTHDPSLAAELASHVALLQGGSLLAEGPTGEVMTGERLSALYQTPLHTLRHNGRLLVFRSA
ncbi:MAG: ABC transporter ATP-binding protein [Verrucomicrobiota bacterium]|jgi:iron complex transport system ATP-binding protein|nr:ABC transporter ATP-binding protein [Verrucomicrobiota bacterium]